MNYPKARDFIIKKLSNELEPDLTYHSIEHTLDVLNAASNYAELEKVEARDRLILQTARSTRGRTTSLKCLRGGVDMVGRVSEIRRSGRWVCLAL